MPKSINNIPLHLMIEVFIYLHYPIITLIRWGWTAINTLSPWEIFPFLAPKHNLKPATRPEKPKKVCVCTYPGNIHYKAQKKGEK